MTREQRRDEKKLENRVLKYFRGKGMIAEHLGGPEGWPDVLVLLPNDLGYSMIELKSCKRKNFADVDARALMEKSQIAFFAAHPKHHFDVLIECKDGIYGSEFMGAEWEWFEENFELFTMFD